MRIDTVTDIERKCAFGDKRRDPYVIESIGERFLRVRSLPGKHFNLDVGSEVTIEDMPFIVRQKPAPNRLILEGLDS